jgi:hypothetical protein
MQDARGSKDDVAAMFRSTAGLRWTRKRMGAVDCGVWGDPHMAELAIPTATAAGLSARDRVLLFYARRPPD